MSRFYGNNERCDINLEANVIVPGNNKFERVIRQSADIIACEHNISNDNLSNNIPKKSSLIS